MCHKSCGTNCDGKNFTPCPLFPGILYTMIWVSIVIIFLVIVSWVCLISKRTYEEIEEDPESYTTSTNSDGFVVFDKKEKERKSSLTDNDI